MTVSQEVPEKLVIGCLFTSMILLIGDFRSFHCHQNLKMSAFYQNLHFHQCDRQHQPSYFELASFPEQGTNKKNTHNRRGKFQNVLCSARVPSTAYPSLHLDYAFSVLPYPPSLLTTKIYTQTVVFHFPILSYCVSLPHSLSHSHSMSCSLSPPHRLCSDVLRTY